MVRVGISVEGATEERFVIMVLRPYLENRGLYITPIGLNGSVNIDKVRNELQNMANSFDYVTTLYDFYGFKNKVGGETKESLEARILANAHTSVRSKLIPYVQMYEFEGLLFSCPDSLAKGLNSEDAKPWADAILKSFFNQPEQINNSPQTAPSKRLIKYTAYKKTIHGPLIADIIGIDKIRSTCGNFDDWLKKLEDLA